MTTPIVFLDTETTGIHPGRKVWEVAMIRRDELGQRETQFFVQVDLKEADPFGLKVGGFYDRHPFGRYLSKPGRVDPGCNFVHEGDRVPDYGAYLYPSDAASIVARWTHGAHIVGAVPNFDTEVLDAMLRYEDLAPAWHYHLIDVENLAAGFLAGRRFGYDSDRTQPRDNFTPRGMEFDERDLPWKSDDLAAAIGLAISEGERHTALGDARWAMRIYDAIMGTAAPAASQ